MDNTDSFAGRASLPSSARVTGGQVKALPRSPACPPDPSRWLIGEMFHIFRLDTLTIAQRLNRTEAEVYRELHEYRDELRKGMEMEP